MYKILIFAGTTEGRIVTEELSKFNVNLLVSVATDYGKTLLPKKDNVKVSAVRLTKDEMVRLMINEDIETVIDATHPYAIEVTANIIEACKEANKEYVRLLRASKEYNSDAVVYVKDMDEATQYLNSVTGNILLTTGSKDLKTFTKVKDYKNRIFPRILPMVNVLQSAFDLGYLGKNVICMQGPFSEELNLATLRKVNARYLVTKESGDIGGIDEKISAVKAVGGKLVLVARPTVEEGKSLEAVVQYIKEKVLLEG